MLQQQYSSIFYFIDMTCLSLPDSEVIKKNFAAYSSSLNVLLMFLRVYLPIIPNMGCLPTSHFKEQKEISKKIHKIFEFFQKKKSPKKIENLAKRFFPNFLSKWSPRSLLAILNRKCAYPQVLPVICVSIWKSTVQLLARHCKKMENMFEISS